MAERRQFAAENNKYLYASSPFEKEILTLEECLSLMRATRSRTEILIIPSFTATSLSPDNWVPACLSLANEGADAIQLDFFYMGNIIGTDGLSENIVTLLKELISAVNIPIMPKLNVNLPKDYIVPLLVKAGVKYVSLLDSVRSPYLEKSDGKYRVSQRLDPLTTSCFGSWQLPITLSYTYTAAQHGLKVCAGGGVFNEVSDSYNGTLLISRTADIKLLYGLCSLIKYSQSKKLSATIAETMEICFLISSATI